ncbi:hypothetical protein CR513_39463, partial [Mucuna pruriens]
MDIAEICNQKELELKDIGHVNLFKRKVAYALTKSQRVAICKWVKELKLSDGYAFNLGRYVNLNQRKLHGMKIHIVMFSCNIFFLLHWTYYQNIFGTHLELTLTTLNVEKLTVMKGNILVLLCKLEQIFLPSFFDLMEHLPIHLPYEA